MDRDWEAIRREKQKPPDGDWFIWLILAGRGWGKTRTGGEFIAESLIGNPGWRAALVAQTFDDGRDVMVEGESGLEAILQGRGETFRWNRSLGQLMLTNGSRADIYSSERPKQLRGPQHHVAWGDEPAYWNDAPLGDAENTTWSNLKLGLRLGVNPRCVLTTTPKAYRLVKELLNLGPEDGLVKTHGTTYENLANLSDKFRREVVSRYENTRLGQQELYAQLLDDVEGALWSRKLILYGDAPSVPLDGVMAPGYSRIVVAIDPAGSYGPDSDETGIVAAGTAGQNAYVLTDLSGRFSPGEWARRAISAYRELKADAIVGETNYGGEMVEGTLRSQGFDGRFIKVTASKGKLIRAEPVVGLYEKGRVYHVKPLPILEDQLCTYTGAPGESPDRLDALVWGLTELMLGNQVFGDYSMIA